MSGYQVVDDDAPAAVVRAVLDQAGHVVVRGLLPLDQVAAVRAHVHRVALETGWASGPDGRGRLRPRTGWRQALSAEALDCAFRRMWTHEPLHRLAHCPPVLRLMRDLLGPAVLVHPQKVLRVVPPNDPDLLPEVAGPHQDFPELQGSPRQLTMWSPLHPVGPGDGALPVYPGSHRFGVLPLRLADNPSGWEAVPPPGVHPVEGELDPGDVLLFTTFTVHGGASNTGDAFRISLDVRYQPVADPVSESAFSLPGYRYGWSEVYRSWPRSAGDLQYYWTSLPLRVTPHDPRWEDWRDRAALDAAARGDEVALRALVLAAQQSADPEVRRRARCLLAGPPYETSVATE